MNELGNLLRKLRGKESLRAVSERSGVSHNYLSIVEKGADPRSGAPVQPSPDTLKRLAAAYKYDYENLLVVAGIIDDETKKDAKIEEKIKLANDIDNLPEHQRKAVIDLVESLKTKR